MDVGEANDYFRLTVRTIFVVVPMAAVRGDRAVLERAARWFKSVEGRFEFPDSPYARIMRPAIDLDLADHGLWPGYVPEVEPRIASFNDELAGPSWSAAVDRVLRSWLAAGEIDGFSRALEAIAGYRAQHPTSSHHGAGMYQLLRARLDEARGDTRRRGRRCRPGSGRVSTERGAVVDRQGDPAAGARWIGRPTAHRRGRAHRAGAGSDWADAVDSAPMAAAQPTIVSDRPAKGWLATLIVAALMVAIVAGGFIAQNAVANEPPKPITRHGLVVTPLPGWEFAGRAEDGDSIVLTNGNGSLAITVVSLDPGLAVPARSRPDQLDDKRAEWLKSGTVTATDIVPVVVGVHAGRRFSYSGTFADVPTPVEGEVTGFDTGQLVVLFDGWAGMADYTGVKDDIDAMISSAVIP